MFRMKVVVPVILILCCYSFLLFAESLGDKETVVLEDLVSEALRTNPQIQAVYNDWQAAKEKIKRVASLPDPRASYT